MNKTTQPGPLEVRLSDQLGPLPEPDGEFYAWRGQYRVQSKEAYSRETVLRLLAAEREQWMADALRFRWLAERTAATGLARWVHPFQFLCEAVDERMKAGATMCD